MAYTRENAVLSLEWADDALNGTDYESTRDLVGVFAVITNDGKGLKVAVGNTEPHGIITYSDGQDQYKGNGGDIALTKYSGMPVARLGAAPGNITAGVKLKKDADGRVSAATGAAGEMIVAKAWSVPANPVENSLITVTLLEPYTSSAA